MALRKTYQLPSGTTANHWHIEGWQTTRRPINGGGTFYSVTLGLYNSQASCDAGYQPFERLTLHLTAPVMPADILAAAGDLRKCLYNIVKSGDWVYDSYQLAGDRFFTDAEDC